MITSIGFRGFGCALPAHVRKNDDPIFDQFHALMRASGTETELFEGVDERRCLGPGESLEDLMVVAGQRALDDAKIASDAIDRLYGYASVSEFLTPNGLFRVHRGLELPSRTMVVPIDDNFTNFISGALFGWEAITAGRAENVLIDCGSSWSRHVDYRASHSLVAGDGAGAAVLGPSKHDVILDYAQETFSDEDFYRGMTMQVRFVERGGVRELQTDEQGLPVPTFAINQGGVRLFMLHGLEALPRLVRTLLDRNGLRADQVTFIGHQGAKRLMGRWAEAIQPGQYLHTVQRFGDLGSAAIPITLATRIAEVTTEYFILGAPGPGAHFAALLVRR